MRIGIYLGRHAGGGGGIGVYARGFLQSLLGLLEDPARENVELVFYGDSSLLKEDILKELNSSAALSLRSADGKSPRDRLRRTAESVLRESVKSQKIRVVTRQLPSLPPGLNVFRKLNMLLDQISVPLLASFDRVSLVHSLANLGLIFSKKPQVITVHDLYQGWNDFSSNQGGGLTEKFYRLMFRRQFRVAETVITDARHVAEEIQSRYQLGTDRIRTIPLGLDSDFLDAFSDWSEEEILNFIKNFRRSHNLKQGSILLFASSDPRKNLSKTLEALNFLPSEVRKTPLVVKALDLEAEQTVRRFLAESWDSLSVTFLPWCDRSELVAVYLAAKVLLVPSLGEGFGYPALEALACGAPVVSGPNEYLSSPPVEGYFECDPTSSIDIAEVLKSVLGPVLLQARVGGSNQTLAEFCRDEVEELTRRIRFFRAIARPESGELSDESIDPRLRRTILGATRETFQVYEEINQRIGGR